MCLAQKSTILLRPLVEGEMLTGSQGPVAAEPTGRTAVPLSEIQSWSVRRIHGGKTALLVGGVGLAALVVLAAATYEGPFEATAP